MGSLDGNVTSSYSLADVTGYSTSTGSIHTYAGGLVGYVNSGGSVSASYAGGAVSANTVSHANNALAGGLVGFLSSGASVSASYARATSAAVTTGITGGSYAGGLVGRQNGNIIASFSTGKPTATGDGTVTAGGLAGRRTGGTTSNSYWDTEASGVSTSAAGVGKTTSELQTPAAYGTNTSTDIYANWDLDLDSDNTNDDPWDFGTAGQYPALKYGGHTPAAQRPVVTLSVSRSTIWERALTTPPRVSTTTITATMSAAWNKAVAVTPATSTAYTLGTSAISFTEGRRNRRGHGDADGGEQLPVRDVGLSVGEGEQRDQPGRGDERSVG